MKKTYPTDEEQKATPVAEPTAAYGIPAAVAEIWQTIQGLSLSNKRWLAEKLVEQVDDDEVPQRITSEELASCVSLDEVRRQLLDMDHDHTLSLFEQSCQELKLSRDGVIVARPVEELLNEL